MGKILSVLITSELDLRIFKKVWYKGVKRFPHVLSLVVSNQGCVVLALLVASSVAKTIILQEIKNK